MPHAETVRFRPHQAIVVAALVTFLGAFPLIFGPELPDDPITSTQAQPGSTLRWYLLPILLIPLLVGVWALRTGTDVNPEGLRLRALLGERWLAWSQVATLGTDHRGRAVAQLHDGRQVHLPAVRGTDLPRVVAASGQQLSRPSDPEHDSQ